MIKTKFAVFLALALAAEASAQSTWIGGNTTNNWLTGTNWSTGASPNATDATVVFSSAGSTAWTNATNTIGTLLVSGGQAVIGNANITSDVLNLDTSSGKPVISNTTLIFMYADLAGTNGFTKLGSGELSFRFNGNPMLFTGDINLNAGTLTLNQDSSLGNTNNDIIVGGTSTLSSSPGGNTGTVTLGAGRSISVTNGTLSIQNGNANVGTAINGAISGAGNLTFAGTGTLTLNGANTYSGTTLVSGGRVNIGASGTIGTNSLTVGNTATMDLGGSTQTVRGLTLSSAAGTTRVFTFTNGSLIVGDGNTLNFNGTNGTTADFSGLTSYVANSPSRSLTVQPNTPTAGSSTNYMLLAKTGIASNTLTYSTIRVGGGSGASQGTLNGAIMQLGKVNAIKTGLLTLGGFNGYGTIELPAGISNATLSLRGVDGTSRMGGLVVGETSSGTRSGAGTLNLSNGVIDALVTNTYIGVFGANSTGPATTSLLAMGGGTFDTVNMVMATITNTGITNASASVGATFQQNGGTVTVQTLTMGQSDTTVNVSGPVFLPTYNLNSSNAVLRAQTITAGASTNYGGGTLRKINFGAGTIQNYDASTDLTISGKDTTSSGRIEIAVASNSSSRTFLADAGRKITIESTAVLTSTGNIVKAGLGTLVLNGANTYSGGTAVSAGTLTVNNTSGSGTGSGALTVSSGATLNGVGFIGSATDIGGIHSPGNSPGIQTFTSGLTYLTGASFVWELTANASAVRGTAFDGVDVTGGTLSINTGVANNLVFNSIGSSVVWSDAFWDSNQVWLVFSNAASPSIASGTTFDTINISFDSLGNDFATSRAGSSFIWTNIGNDVYLNYTVPEPGTYALLALAAAVLGVQALRRRSRRQLCGVGRLPTLNPEKNGIHKA